MTLKMKSSIQKILFISSVIWISILANTATHDGYQESPSIKQDKSLNNMRDKLMPKTMMNILNSLAVTTYSPAILSSYSRVNQNSSSAITVNPTTAKEPEKISVNILEQLLLDANKNSLMQVNSNKKVDNKLQRNITLEQNLVGYFSDLNVRNMFSPHIYDPTKLHSLMLSLQRQEKSNLHLKSHIPNPVHSKLSESQKKALELKHTLPILFPKLYYHNKKLKLPINNTNFSDVGLKNNYLKKSNISILVKDKQNYNNSTDITQPQVPKIPVTEQQRRIAYDKSTILKKDNAASLNNTNLKPDLPNNSTVSSMESKKNNLKKIITSKFKELEPTFDEQKRDTLFFKMFQKLNTLLVDQTPNSTINITNSNQSCSEIECILPSSEIKVKTLSNRINELQSLFLINLTASLTSLESLHQRQRGEMSLINEIMSLNKNYLYNISQSILNTFVKVDKLNDKVDVVKTYFDTVPFILEEISDMASTVKTEKTQQLKYINELKNATSKLN